jgi:hypothetical protein
LAITSTSSRPFEKIFLDIVGPLTTTLSGNTYILTMQDDLTKYSLGIPIPDHQANTVAKAFVVPLIINSIDSSLQYKILVKWRVSLRGAPRSY